MYYWDPWKRETLTFKALLGVLAVIEMSSFYPEVDFSNCSFPTVTMFLLHCTLDLYFKFLIFKKIDILNGGATVIDNSSDKATLFFFFVVLYLLSY